MPLVATGVLTTLAGSLAATALLTMAMRQDGPLAGGMRHVETLLVATTLLIVPAAGRLADRLDTARQIRRVALAGLATAPLAAHGFVAGDLVSATAATFLLFVQRAALGPAMRAIPPRLLPPPALPAAQALSETGKVAAMLAGLLGGVLAIQWDAAPWLAAAIALGLVGAAAASCLIPATPPAAPSLAIDRNPLRDGWRLARGLLADPALRVPALGFAWYWLVVSVVTYVAVWAGWAMAGDALGATLAAAGFVVGFGTGALLAARRMRGVAALHLGRWSGLAVSVLAIELWLAVWVMLADHPGPPGDGLLGSAPHCRVLIDLTLLAASLGLFAVPPAVALQVRGAAAQLGRIHAASTLLAALLAVPGAVAVDALIGPSGEAMVWLMLGVGLLNLPVALAWPRAVRPVPS